MSNHRHSIISLHEAGERQCDIISQAGERQCDIISQAGERQCDIARAFKVKLRCVRAIRMKKSFINFYKNSSLQNILSSSAQLFIYYNRFFN